MTRWTRILATSVAIALCLSACGSSSKSSSSKSTSTPASTATSSTAATTTAASTGASTTGASAAAPTGAPIVVGSICSCSGTQASAVGQVGGVAQAWAKSANAAGGINGHPVKLILKDDGGNPATSVQDVKALVADHVIAIVDDFSLVDASWASYIAGTGVPVIGGLPQEAPFLSNPDFFPSGTTVAIQTLGTLTLGKAAGAKNIGIEYCAESPVCAEIIPLATGEAKLLGIKVTPQKISATAPSYAAPCLAAKSAGVKAMYVIDNASISQRFLDGCAQQGYKPLFTGSSNSTATSWAKDPNLNGTVLAGSMANAFDKSTPAVAQFYAFLAKFDPGITGSAQFTPVVDEYPYVAGEMFEAAAKAANVGPTSTGADVKKGLYALKNVTFNGLTPPLTFTPGKPAFVGCYFTVKLQSGTYGSLNGNKPSCLSATEATELGKALG